MCHVLVIDDEQMICSMLEKALNRINCSVETADNALGGISKFDSGKFDVVITDVCMPGFDGHDVVRHIRGSKNCTTPIIGVSGTPCLLYESDFDDVLAKPFTIQALVDKIRSLTISHLASGFES